MELNFIITFLDWIITNYPAVGSWVLCVIFALAGLSIVATGVIKIFNWQPQSWLTKVLAFILELFSWAQTKENKQILTEAKSEQPDAGQTDKSA